MSQAYELSNTDSADTTNYGTFVVDVLVRATSGGTQSVDQKIFRQCIGLASSFLITDTNTNPHAGIDTWYTGFSRLVDVVVALHSQGELELDTINTASKACSECWMVSGSWRGLSDCRNRVAEMATKLKKVLDPNGRTYRGDAVYSP